MYNRFITQNNKDNLIFFNNKIIKKTVKEEEILSQYNNIDTVVKNTMSLQKNKKTNKKTMKITNELEDKLDSIIGLSDEEEKIIRVKKDNGLLEKSPSKIILIEDNRQVLTD